MRYKSPKTLVGIVRNARRDDEEATVANRVSLLYISNQGGSVLFYNGKSLFIIDKRGSQKLKKFDMVLHVLCRQYICDESQSLYAFSYTAMLLMSVNNSPVFFTFFRPFDS